MRSDLMKSGVSRAPHRSLLKALGLTDREIARPFVAVVSSKSDYIPGHTHLDTIVKAVEAIEKRGDRDQIVLESYYIEKDDLKETRFEKILYPIE